MWFAPGLCGCVLTGGVIYRAVQVYKYLKKRKKTDPEATIIS